MNAPSQHADFSMAPSHEAMVRHRRRVAQSRTADEHALVVEQLQTAAMKAIQSDPVAYDAFLKRNYRKRRPEAVARLLAEMMERS